jgi:hypothetical protein
MTRIIFREDTTLTPSELRYMVLGSIRGAVTYQVTDDPSDVGAVLNDSVLSIGDLLTLYGIALGVVANILTSIDVDIDQWCADFAQRVMRDEMGGGDL